MALAAEPLGLDIERADESAPSLADLGLADDPTLLALPPLERWLAAEASLKREGRGFGRAARALPQPRLSFHGIGPMLACAAFT